ncbi:MAG: DUF2802 domain-containing protein [Steroidobacteraceae bacterium]|nr:DUF2802 domain-containing protein [Pseudomonadota bacterium]MBP6106574.1 DUF2802 domain-containing protein [Steroidobacteraceae bacterium]MBP7014317.1 DUF2802 domain-containing protein [Steroidobacteraceae bacterium]HQW10309.1 DUF2802 domain-containing protein [Steroidobacteraceae bacterium]
MQSTDIVVIAGGALALLTVGALLSWVAVLARRTRSLQALVRTELARVRDELAQVSAQALRIGNQQHAIEGRIRQMAERQGRLELRGEGRPFEQAIENLRGGATRNDLVARFGLTDSEVALLVRLHGGRV